ncbi:MAG: LON peptidase substrate-binding domain-containing protein [Bdellovibrionota bacterium]
MSGDAKRAEIELFVFPLPQVSLFPMTTKPLNIFEPRYKEMVEDALRDERLIALAYTDVASAASREQGLLSHVRSIAGYGTLRVFERRDDGTLIVLIDAVGKLVLETAVPSEKPYIVAKGRKVDEATTLDPAHVFLLNRIMKRFRAQIEAHMDDARERERFWQRLQTPEEKVNAYCTMVVEDPEQRQRLLETDGVSERLSLATLLLDSEKTSH